MSTITAVETTARRILRLREVEARIGFKRAYIYRMISENKFPRPTRIGIRAVGWDSLEVDAWVNERFQEPQKQG